MRQLLLCVGHGAPHARSLIQPRGGESRANRLSFNYAVSVSFACNIFFHLQTLKAFGGLDGAFIKRSHAKTKSDDAALKDDAH